MRVLVVSVLGTDFFKGKERPTYKGKLPDGHNQLGLALLGITGDRLVDGKQIYLFLE